MKSVVVYYSLTGNTSLVARMIADRIGAETIRLEPEKKIPSDKTSKYFWGGKSVIFNEKPKLVNDDLNLDGYDTLIIGTPIWARSFSSPVNTFLTETAIKGKDIYLFATHSPGTETEKCFVKMKEKLSGNNIKGTVGFEDVKKTSAKELDDKVRKFCRLIMN